MAQRQVKAIAAISGGLDSTLAVALMKRQGVAIRAVSFRTGFSCAEARGGAGSERRRGSPPPNDAQRAATALGVELETIEVSGPSYLDVVTHPKYGYGANANPCIDCHIFMFSRARQVMVREGADFVFTGEVLGQRPKSQRRDTLWIVERDSGLAGRLLRPLSAKLLPPSIPEKDGLIDRDKLCAISGRSRKAQLALAAELGVTEWPQPAGGCLLTDETFGRRFHDLVARRPDRHIGEDEVGLLATGRHFRLSEATKLVVGRNEVENLALERFAKERYRLEATDVMGPVALVEGEPTPEEREVASRIVAWYCRGRVTGRVVVEWRRGDQSLDVLVEPYPDERAFESLRI